MGSRPAAAGPEQLAGRRATLGPTSDIHAIGVILYELLTGRPPFLADTHAETIRRIQTEDPVPPRRLNPKVPRDLEVLCLSCLGKDPRRRYRSAGDLADDLGRWLDGRPISARPVPLVEKGWRWCRRRPGVAALLATLAMTLSVGFLVILGLWREAEAARRRAEADYEVGRATLAEILDLGEHSLMATVVVPRDRFVASLDSSRNQIVQLAAQRPDDPAVWNLLAAVKLFLGRNLEFQERLAEAEALYTDSLSDWDRIIARDPGQTRPMYRRWQTLECLGRILKSQGKRAESISDWERAVATGESLLPLLDRPDFNTMTVCRSALARMLERRGDPVRARGVLAADVAMLREIPPDARTPFLAGQAQQDWGSLVRLRWETETMAEASSATRSAASRPADTQADPRDAAVECEAGYRLVLRNAEIAKRQRDAGHLDDARKTVDQMLIFGQHLVARHPEQPPAHLTLCEAHFQSSKIGWKRHDPAAIEAGLTQAVRASQQALSLDPRNADARRRCPLLAKKLADFLASKRDGGPRIVSRLPGDPVRSPGR